MFAVLALVSHGAEWQVVESFDAAKANDVATLGGATGYTYTTGDIPASMLPADSVERKIIFGGRPTFAWGGANPDAHYKIKAVFLSDSTDRLQQVQWNGQSLGESFSLPEGKTLEREWDVLSNTITDGNITIAISSTSGANTVLSRLELLSDRPQTFTAPRPLAEILAEMKTPMPRLSPRPVTVFDDKSPLVSLDGVWKFNPVPPAGFEQFGATETKSWKKIEVPGEWVMEGFEVPTNSAAAYWREFNVPKDWSGQRIKLRFDAVHSDCRVFVNGRQVGAHEGCFTAFELDITDAVRPGRNTLALAVKSESVADMLASATQYAAHQLGGITRKVQLFTLPKMNVASQILTTTFDPEFKDANLNVQLEIADESTAANAAVVKFTLTDAAGKMILVTTTNLPPVFGGQSSVADFSLPVAAPKKWDSEHPYLYSLKTELLADGNAAEMIAQHVGFRQVEVRGNQLFINGVAVKLRGACRHEVDPVRGRSLTPEDWQKDAEPFRAANVNYIRTSHYPPAEEFLDLCDRYGIFVECESPLCWVNHGANAIWGSWDYRDPKLFPYFMRAEYENLAANRNHPCVIIWSLANESYWSPLFAEANRRVKLADPTRPTSFHDQCWGSYNNGGSQADIAVYHYPGENGPAKCDTETRPVLFGEYCHVECYNRRELVTDPGVREDWGRGFVRMYDLMYQHEGCLGGAIWAGIDDVFCLPDGKYVGYGMWGSICDGWRREKPEFWQVKKTYSPVRVMSDALPLPAPGETIRIPVENRYNFANLSEASIAWKIGKEQGTVHLDLPARHSGEILIPAPAKLKEGAVLHLTFTDPRGFVCDEDNVLLGKSPEVATVSGKFEGKLSFTQTDGEIQIRGGDVEYVINRQTGQFICGKVDGKTVLIGGPSLMVLPLQDEACEPVDLGIWKPLNNVCENWKAGSVTARQSTDGGVVVTVNGSSTEADGGYQIHLDAAGGIKVSYDFAYNISENPRQWGMVFFAPKDFETFRWNRKAQWSFYPAEDIGRPIGTAIARIASNDAPYATHPPGHPWSQDATELGGNDFSSTKVAIHEASLAAGSVALQVVSDGHQSIRAFIADGQAGLLVTGFHTGGGDGFFGAHFAAERRPLKPGSRLADMIQLRLSDD